MHRRHPTTAAGLIAAAIVSAIVSAPTRAAAADPLVPATDRQVTFVVDGTTTYGTVHVPAHHAGKRLPAALLLPGSGPTDRNGDQLPAFPVHTLTRIADVLDTQGVMSLRFDKYGTGQTGLGAFTGRLGELDYPAQLRQAAAAYALLHGQPEADRHAMLLFGHSEGGLSALLLAATVRPRPSGLALLEPLDQRFLDRVRGQQWWRIDQARAAGEITPEQARQDKAGVARVISQFRAGRPVDFGGLDPGLAAELKLFVTGYVERYMRSIDAIDPAQVAGDLPHHLRTLITCGTDDVNVPCESTGALVATLHKIGSTGPGLVTLPSVDHELHTPGAAVDGPLAPAAVAAITTFTARWSHQEC
ncbi:hypothetical protein ACWT_4551 [Actinoplanes sp. SE50]|nr:putative secreted protein [Actinoplanes sp. SE50/110]ATO83966.1 hypothetical protein ACWT_4551 [Actinoplanes sp. SE50]SLM01376.1 hypothetical protein ACSP50_4612 [Actinoplanes sp. SE50/110]